jgi:hypothetical protein
MIDEKPTPHWLAQQLAASARQSLMPVNVSRSCGPRAVRPAMITTETRAAIRPYSIA